MDAAVRTRYAQSGDVDIAYQVIGDGPHTVLMMIGAGIPIDFMDAEPRLARFHRRVASFARVIRYDQRGLGMSGHLPANHELSAATWATDAVAVLDAVGCERAFVFAPSTAAMVGIQLAGAHPERVEGLIVFNGAARALWAEDYPAGVPLEYVQSFVETGIRDDALELGFDGLALLAPSASGEAAFRSWWDRAGNVAATPSMARTTSLAVAMADVRDMLPKITAPTLVAHRVDNVFITIEHGRYLRDHLPHARYRELPGRDNLFWIGDTAELLDEIEEFVTGQRGGGDSERVLSTIMFTDIVGSTDRAAELGDTRWRDLLDAHDQLVRAELVRFDGREVKTAGDGFVATFASPSRALDCAESIVARVRSLGLEVRAGIHAGEIEIRGTDVAGMAVHIGARVAAAAAGGEVLVSSTVREIVTGSAREFTPRGSHQLKGVTGEWALYALLPNRVG